MQPSPQTSIQEFRKEILRQSIYLVIFLAALFGLLNFLGVFKPKANPAHLVTYRVEGSTTTAIITYTQADGEQTGRENVGVPWKKAVRFREPTTVVLTAGNLSQTGTIRCILLLDGEEWKRETASSPQDKVSCAGIVP
jgi:hypothetical protein